MRGTLLAKVVRQTEFYREGGQLPSLALLKFTNPPIIGNNVLIISWFAVSSNRIISKRVANFNIRQTKVRNSKVSFQVYEKITRQGLLY